LWEHDSLLCIFFCSGQLSTPLFYAEKKIINSLTQEGLCGDSSFLNILFVEFKRKTGANDRIENIKSQKNTHFVQIIKCQKVNETSRQQDSCCIRVVEGVRPQYLPHQVIKKKV
jgi:hypothetical protein